VGEYTTSGTVVNATLISGLDDPEGIAVSGGDLFITCNNSSLLAGSIAEYTTSGALVNAALVTGLASPRGIAISGNDIFVGNTAQSSVGEYTTAGAVVNADFINGVVAAGIAVSGQDVFVLNSGDGGPTTVVEYTTAGVAVGSNPLVTLPVAAEGIAVSGGDLYITRDDGEVREYTTSGQVVGAPTVTGLVSAEGIVISGQNIFVTTAGLTLNGGGAIAEFAVGHNIATADDVDTLNPQPDLVITKSDNLGGSSASSSIGSAHPGQAITYTITVSNKGPSDAVDASVVDAVPSGLSGATFTATATGGASGFSASGSGGIDDTDVDLPAGSTITYTVHATVSSTATGTLSNAAKLAGPYVNSQFASTLISGLNDPASIVVSGNDVFFLNTSEGTISEYTTAGAVVNASLVSGLTEPAGLALSGNDLFVSESNGTIGEYTTSGATVNAALISGLSAPGQLVVSGNDLLVAESNSTIGEYTTSGALVNASLITGFADLISFAISGNDLFVARDSLGIPFGSDADDIGSVSEFTTSGTLVNASFITGLGTPSAIIASGGDLFVIAQGLSEYTTAGVPVNTQLVPGLGASGAAISNGVLYVPEIPDTEVALGGAAGGVNVGLPGVSQSDNASIATFTFASQTATETDSITVPAPKVTGAATTENVQTTSGLVITPGAGDGAAYFQIYGITGGTLYESNGTTPIANNSYITLAQGEAGLKFTPNSGSLVPGGFTARESTTASAAGIIGSTTRAAITVTLAGPSVTGATTMENMQTTSGLVIKPGAKDSSAAYFQIYGITGGTLYQSNGTTPIANNSYITLAQGAAGLKFTPNPGSLVAGGFTVAESTTAGASGLSGPAVRATVTVNQLAGPLVTNAKTTENTQTTSGLVIKPGTGDGAAAYFQIYGITGGTLYQSNGTTPIANNSYITVAQGEAGLKFTPNAGSLVPGGFNVRESLTSTAAGLSGPTVRAAIAVLLAGPTVTNATATENAQTTSGLVIKPGASDSSAAYFQIYGITGGTLYQSNGTTPIANNSYITLAQGEAGLRFTPNPGSLVSGGFTATESTSASASGLSGPAVRATVTITPLTGPSVTSATTTENTQTTSGLVITPGTGDSAAAYFQIYGITGGTLYQNNGTTPIANNSYITLAQGEAGLKFTPNPGSLAAGGFTVTESTTGSASGLSGPAVRATVTVTAASSMATPDQLFTATDEAVSDFDLADLYV
ncbi:MAG TPA: hypothetical protein VMF30_04250, partial [Pirellulales bacterium]|nr:hypothetical protein [Pirellulales bacterium]